MREKETNSKRQIIINLPSTTGQGESAPDSTTNSHHLQPTVAPRLLHFLQLAKQLYGIEAHLPSFAKVAHVFPPAFEAGGMSEQQRAQLRSHVPTARLEHLPAAASWSQVYLLRLGVLFEQVGQVPFEHVNRHLPEGTIERDEQEVLWATTEQLAVDEGEMSEQKASWSAGTGGRGVGVGEAVEVGEGEGVAAGVVVGEGAVGLGVCGGGGG